MSSDGVKDDQHSSNSIPVVQPPPKRKQQRTIVIMGTAVVALVLLPIITGQQTESNLNSTEGDRPDSLRGKTVNRAGEGRPISVDGIRPSGVVKRIPSPTEESEEPLRVILDGPTSPATKAALASSPTSSLSNTELPNGGPNLHHFYSVRNLSTTFLPYVTATSREKDGASSNGRNALPFILDFITFSDDLVPRQKNDDEKVLQLLAAALGRCRLKATFAGAKWLKWPSFDSKGNVEAFLFKHAPAWYVSRYSDQEALNPIVLRRRSKLFCFAVTGGGDSRANWVEWTWGRRTPLQWYADAWSDVLRPIIDLHPQYLKDKFKFLTFKMSRIWERVYKDFGVAAEGQYDWYVRLWDDNYFYEENVWNSLGRLNPSKATLVGKIGWRYLADSAVFPFAGGGAGWFLSHAGLTKLGPSIADAEAWFFKLRARRDIFLPHFIHDEDVFLTAWFHLLNMSFINIPGVEHVSPGMMGKQRCMPKETLYKLRWDPNTTIVFDYPAHDPQFRIEEAWYAYTKPIVWHYMSPKRLVWLESITYPERKDDPLFDRRSLPTTNADIAKAKKKCYPGFTGEKEKVTPTRGRSVFEQPLPDPPPPAEDA